LYQINVIIAINMNPENPTNNNMEKIKIIKELFPESLPTSNEIEKRYPPRELKDGAMVTRIAPSPTGFMHIGGLYAALISERLAHQTDGVFYLRIEDTDKKREVEGASELITESLEHYGIKIDEGETTSKQEIGQYGPYKQSERAEIYKTYVKSLVEKGQAYPCFSTNEELEEMRNIQEAQSVRPGYYKQWAKWRDKSDQEVLRALEEGKKFVIRFKSDGDFNNKIFIKDVLLGDRELSENDQDIVIMKSDGLPTYHMAHIIDDHLMGTTHVIRGNEWLSSLPLHLQLFKAMDWQPPKYGHIFPIQKMEDSSKRKLSKRKDPEANVAYYDEQGYPEDAIIEYLLNLANSNFEDWRKANPNKSNQTFALTLEKLSSSSGPLFDFNKLNDISKEVVAKYSAEEVYGNVLNWAKKYDTELAKIMEENSEYTKRILDIERSDAIKVRKDIGKWSDVKKEIWYFFDQTFHLTKEDTYHNLSGIDLRDVESIIKSFIESYNENDSKDEWFEKIKNISLEHSYAESAKAFKKSPEKYKGNVADVAKIFRVLLTGRTQTPDLYSIMQVMGKDRVLKRLSVWE
jgi:glutamyl-tRNA synthetase